jgi:PAS domain S-box-containing protein
LKTARGKHASRPAPSRELARLRARLADSEETLRAIRTGEVDAVVVAGDEGPQVFTLQGAGHAYRVLIESMNEGALTLAPDKTILYANHCFSRMVKCPLEQVTGSSFRRFLSAEDEAALGPLLKGAVKSGSKIQVLLTVSDGSQMPAHISIRPLAKNGSKSATIGMVVTDMTEARRTEELLRALTNRVVEVQEAERGRVALELHDNITQLLCAVLVRCQTLADKLSSHAVPLKGEAIKLREMLGQTAGEVERISRNLRPSVLDESWRFTASFSKPWKTWRSTRARAAPPFAWSAWAPSSSCRSTTTEMGSTRIATRQDETERAISVCSACANEPFMWVADSRSNPFAAPAQKSRFEFPCRAGVEKPVD